MVVVPLVRFRKAVCRLFFCRIHTVADTFDASLKGKKKHGWKSIMWTCLVVIGKRMWLEYRRLTEEAATVNTETQICHQNNEKKKRNFFTFLLQIKKKSK